MTIAWILCPYKVRPSNNPHFRFIRYAAMDDFTPLIQVGGGAWAEVEVLGNVALCKVNTTDANLTTILATADFQRIPVGLRLTDSLATLTAGQRNAILTRLQAMGYTVTEITNALGGNLANWRTRTLGDLLRFISRRRFKPASMDVNGNVTFSTEEVVPESVDGLDEKVR